MKKYMKGNKMFITEYSSVGEFLQDINSKPNNEFFKNRHESQTKEDNDRGWYYSRDYARAEYIIKTGWDSAAEKMTKKVKMTSGAQSTVRSSRPAYGVVGSQASVPRYLQGIPTNMVSRQMTYSKQKVVTINKGISYSSRFSPETIINESVKALQIIQSMENAGQRVRLNVMWSVSDDYRDYTTVCKVCVKQPDERMNISKMAFPLAHPAMLRRFFFKWLETDNFTTKDMGKYYGYPATQELKNQAMGENEYYIPEEIPDMDALIKQLSEKK